MVAFKKESEIKVLRSDVIVRKLRKILQRLFLLDNPNPKHESTLKFGEWIERLDGDTVIKLSENTVIAIYVLQNRTNNDNVSIAIFRLPQPLEPAANITSVSGPSKIVGVLTKDSHGKLLLYITNRLFRNFPNFERNI